MRIGEVDYTHFTEGLGYWTVKVEDIGDYLPIKIRDSPALYNPFIGWKISHDVETFIEDVVRKIAVPDGEGTPEVECWGNYFNRSTWTYHRYYHLPHIDGPGWVGNLWLSDHPEGSRGTEFYNYKDNWKHDEFNFPRPLEMLKQIETTWQQWDISQVESYGFEYLGTAPAKKNTITIYNSCMPHKQYIGDKCDTSWSQLVQVKKGINLDAYKRAFNLT